MASKAYAVVNIDNIKVDVEVKGNYSKKIFIINTSKTALK